MAPATIPTTMRAWQYTTTTGGIEKNLTLNDAASVPAISSRLGDAELLVQVLAASLNPADYKVPELGLVARAKIHTPATPGMDFCGRVVQTTRTVDDFAIGDLIFGRIDATQHGTLAKYIVAPTKTCAVVPEGVSVDEAAAVGVAGLTAYHAISSYVQPTNKIFINGGSGGTGTFSIQIAKALGCHVTVSCSPAKADLCRSLGADEILDYTSCNISEVLKTKGQVFSLVVDNAGSPDDLYKAADDFLLPEGRFVQVGSTRKYEMFMIRQAPGDLKQLGQWIAEGKVKVVVEETYEMEDLPKAFEKLKTGRSAGKLVVHVA
ncbi:hypothetical protein N0V88_007045 [Collariella sp. IMI 366227]|nr:hypothetical protein N0V88_007045 [Collariella sp. IMI 366227]